MSDSFISKENIVKRIQTLCRQETAGVTFKESMSVSVKSGVGEVMVDYPGFPIHEWSNPILRKKNEVLTQINHE